MDKNTFELLSAEEFADRLGIGRSTVYNWKDNGKLLPKRHFLKFSPQVVRYFWEEERLVEIHEICNAENESRKGKPRKEKPAAAVSRPKGDHGQGINWDY